ncbi:type II/IV secretion system ATPase subunit [Halarchaeum acidiphilum]|nr:type II/IV secretion system ATPase subunit [Halarchaeum acidiphilum]
MSTDEADDAAVGGSTPAEDPTDDVDGAAAEPDSTAADEGEGERDESSGPPVTKGEYAWADFEAEYGDDDSIDPADHLGFEREAIENVLAFGDDAAAGIESVVDQRTVNVASEVDEDAFFSDVHGNTTMVNRYDLEKVVAAEKKTHFSEVERYWVNKPYAFVVLFHSERENEMKYYLVEPYRNPIEDDLREFLTGKLRTAIKYSSGDVAAEGTMDERRDVIERETRDLLERYDIYAEAGGASIVERLTAFVEGLTGGDDADATGADGDADGNGADDGTGDAEADDDTDDAGDSASVVERLTAFVEGVTGDEVADGEAVSAPGDERAAPTDLDGIAARPEPAVLEEDTDTLTQYQVEKLLYYLKRDFIGYERIDGIKHDVNVEDISCDGYNSPVFAYHSDYEQLITNVYHGKESLDDFVVKLAQRSGKGISKRQPQVDATLPDGSRAQLTLGQEVSDHGTNYTIRQFKDVPFTPVDLINWKTFSLEEMAFLWLCIENNKSLIFAGGTASGKTTSLNAVSLFIPSNAKIVSIEDTREVELPQRNWVASVTRPSFGEDEKGDIDEFDLLEAALRQRPDYIVMGEVRGEEGRTLFQVMSTGHTTYTTFHADNVGEVLKRFTTEPINVSKTLFTALDLVSIQAQTRVSGRKVRRNRSITEINRYDAENDEINVSDVFQWEPEGDEFRQLTESNTLDEIQFDRGWSRERLERELFERQVVLAYLIRNGLSEYTEVAATLQAYIADPDTILTLLANDALTESLADLRGMESVLIDVDPEKEEMVPRPDPTEDVYEEAGALLERAEDELLHEYRGEEAPDISFALSEAAASAADADVVVDDSGETPTIEAAGEESDGSRDAEADGGDPAADGNTTSDTGASGE